LFHKGHYNILATTIKEEIKAHMNDESYEGRNALILYSFRLAKRLQKDNELFDAKKFVDACSPDAEQYPFSELYDEG
jgi:hypothetical protein